MAIDPHGFVPDRMLLPAITAGVEPGATAPDPGNWVRARTHSLVDRLGESRARVRAATSRAVLRSWIDERAARLGDRQRRTLRYLAEGGGTRSLDFRGYVQLHSGRGAPSLRTLQRDWLGLRDRGFLVEREGGWVLATDTFAFGGEGG